MNREGTSDHTTWASSRLVVPFIDLAIVAGLIVVGQLTHGQHPIDDPIASLESIVPFVLAWIAIAGIMGLYRSDSGHTPFGVARDTTVCWLAAANVGFLLRGSPLFAGGVPWGFTAVLTGLGLVAIVTSRVGIVVLSDHDVGIAPDR